MVIMEEKKYFEIRGYDSNFDLAGSHIEPLLAIVHGTKQQALDYAETLPRYRSGEYIVGGVYEWKQNIIELEEKLKPKKILANRVYSDATLKSWKKEDLIEQIRILEHNWAAAEESLNNSAKNSEKLFAEQKAEIERLTEELKNCGQELLDTYREQEELQDRNAELQKRVDELQKPINGKFKDQSALQKAYESLEKEFTRRSQHLRELQGKIEQRTLKEINYPWHVGDKVFVVRSATSNNKNFYIFEDTVVQTCVYKNVEANTYWLFIKLMENTSVLEWDFDKVFLTREEAEKKLQELQE